MAIGWTLFNHGHFAQARTAWRALEAESKYEIEATWQSDELTEFQEQITIPSDAVEIGHAYRARVRMKDATGRWSHWSDPVQFVAGSGSITPARR